MFASARLCLCFYFDFAKCAFHKCVYSTSAGAFHLLLRHLFAKTKSIFTVLPKYLMMSATTTDDDGRVDNRKKAIRRFIADIEMPNV